MPTPEPPQPDDGLPLGFDAADLPKDPAPVDEERIGDLDLGHWRSAPGKALARSVAKAAPPPAVAPPAFSMTVLLFTAAVGLLGVFGLAWGSGEVYEGVAESDGVAIFDRPLLDAAVAARTPSLDRWVTDFTNLGGPILMPFVALALTAYAVWRWRSWTPAVLVATTALGALATTIAGKDLIGRARPPRELAVPPYEVSASFPSGHTLNATAILGITAYVLLVTISRVWVRAVAVVAMGAFVVAMGLSRVFLGHHWVTDVIAGGLLGLLWVVVVVTGHRLKITLDRRRRGDVVGGPRHG